MKTVEIGIISDTHVYDLKTELPPRLVEVLKGVDFIVHVGDISTPDVLRKLEEIAPVKAVMGNKIDDQRFFQGQLPEFITFEAGGIRIVVTHGANNIENRLDTLLGKEPQKRGYVQKTVYETKKFLKSLGIKRFSNLQIMRQLLKEYSGKADLIIFGHSHQSYAGFKNEVFFFNPGDAQYSRKKLIHLGIITITNGLIEYKFIDLENKKNVEG